jgi:hypothetical protein
MIRYVSHAERTEQALICKLTGTQTCDTRYDG